MIEQKKEAAVKPLGKQGQRESAASKSMNMEDHLLRQGNNGSMDYSEVQNKFAREDGKKVSRNKYKYGRYE